MEYSKWSEFLSTQPARPGTPMPDSVLFWSLQLDKGSSGFEGYPPPPMPHYRTIRSPVLSSRGFYNNLEHILCPGWALVAKKLSVSPGR